MNGERKMWEKPELVVLLRSKPEEAVLAFCKLSAGSSGPINGAGWCGNATGGCPACAVFGSS